MFLLMIEDLVAKQVVGLMLVPLQYDQRRVMLACNELRLNSYCLIEVQQSAFSFEGTGISEYVLFKRF